MNQPNLQGEVQQKTGQTIFQIIAELQTLERKVDQIVVTSAPGEPGKKGDRGAPGKTAPSTSVFYYKADANSTAANDPGAGKLRWNNATQASATFLYLDWLTTDGFDVTALFKLMGAPQQFIIQDQDLALNYQVWRMTGPVVMMPDWFQVPVAFVSSGGSGVMANNQKIALLIASASGVPGSGAPGGVVGQLQVNGGAGLFAGGNLSGDVATANGTGTTLATVNTTPGTFGDATHVAQVTVDAKGRVTTVSSVTIGISGGQNQTPWLQDIDAATFRLKNAGNVGLGNDLSVLPSATSNIQLVVGGAAALQGRVTVASNQGAGAANVGVIAFANYGITVAEKRIAQIAAFSDTSLDSGAMIFYTFLAGVNNERMRITSAGAVGIGTTTPQAPLSVRGQNAQWVLLDNPDTNYTNTGSFLKISLGAASGNTTGLIQQVNAGGGSGGVLALNANGGSVGVGTATPNGALEVLSIAGGGSTMLRLSSGSTSFSFDFSRDPSTGALKVQGAQVGNNNIVLCPTSGNVGIGVGPAYKLDVAGDCNITGTYRVNGVPISAGGGGGSQTPWLQDIQGGGFQLLNAGNIAQYKNFDGSLSIRIENPSTGASVSTVIHCFAGTAEGYLGLEGSGTGTARTGKVFLYSAQAAGVTLQAVHASGVINFVTGADSPANERMRIAANGNVGINTTNPLSQFSILTPAAAPTTIATANAITIGESSNNPGYRLSIGVFVDASTWKGSIQMTNNNVGSPLILNGNGGRVCIGGNLAPNSLLEIYTGAVGANIDVLTMHGVYSVVNVEQRIKFLGSSTYSLGYIGCGFDAQSSTSGYLAFGTGGNGFFNERVRIDTFGKVGIGTTIPSVPLSLAATIGEKLALYDGGVGANYGFGIQSYQLQIYVPAGARTSIGSGSSSSFTETFTVTSGNKVGVRNGAPGAPLDVNGPIRTTNSEAPVGGVGTEIHYVPSTTSGSVIVYNRDTATALQLRLGSDGGANATVIAPNGNLTVGGTTLASSYLSANLGMYSYGQIFVCSAGVDASYISAAIQVRETNQASGGSSGDNRYRPRISFHWAGVVASQIGMNNDGTICAIDNPGTGYAPFQCSQLNASNLYAPTWNGYYAPGAAVGTAYSVAYFDGNAYLYTTWINTVSGDNGTAPISRFYASSDAFLRYYTIANFRYQLGIATQFTNPPKVLGTVYQNTTGKPITINVVVQFNAANSISVFSDAAAAPATTVAVVSCSSTGIYTLSFLVLQNHYYRVQSGANVVLVSWIEWL